MKTVPKVMHTVTLEVTEEWLKQCSSYVKMFTGISLTPEQMLEVFKTNDNLLIQSLSFGFETGERENFQSALAQKLLGIDWPCQFESNQPQYVNFGERIYQAAIKAGYKVEED